MVIPDPAKPDARHVRSSQINDGAAGMVHLFFVDGVATFDERGDVRLEIQVGLVVVVRQLPEGSHEPPMLTLPLGAVGPLLCPIRKLGEGVPALF
jgi:hypothetical protein